MARTLWDMQDDYDQATDDATRNALLDEMIATGHSGVAATIQPRPATEG